jgi:CMP-N-acetylneuraminic acid synthetase
MKKKILALILARKNSKRLKNKNVYKLGNKPLVTWTFNILKKKNIRRLFTDIIVSTDSNKIKKLSENYKFLSPWIRPKNLSGQFISSESSALHALKWYEKNIKKVDAIFLFQPTSPFRSQKKIKTAIKMLTKNPKRQIVSVCAKETYKFKKNDINGSIYLTPISTLKKFKTFKKKGFMPLKTYRQSENIDIDTLEDMVFAEKMINM